MEPEKTPKPKFNKPMIIWIVVILLLTVFQFKTVFEPDVSELPYSDFVAKVKTGQVRSFNLEEDSISAHGELSNGKKYDVKLLPNDSYIQQLLIDNNVTVKVITSNRFMNFLLTVVIPPLIFVFILWFVFARQMRGIGKGAMTFAKSKAKLLEKGKQKITFADVAGIQEAKEEVEEIIDFLKDPKKFQKLGGRIPKGILLVGPPGTGKTLLAKAIAGEADVPFFSISGSDFVEMFVGVGASRVRDMFEQGKKNAPCIIFMDEIDAVGRHRGAGIGGGNDEREQTLNAILVEMDGFDTEKGVIMIAATNRPDVLDPALLRPGRFDRQIVIDLPDLKGREGILKVHTKKVILDENIDIERIARGTPGFSGADLENLVNEAALLAARRNKKSVTMPELEEARDKVRWGKERKSRAMDQKDTSITAYHEAGHAIVIHELESTEPLHKVTIIPRGIAYLGATMQLPEKDKYHETKNELIDRITGYMGGRIAEEITFGDVTSGARSDLKSATEIARKMVCEWGMSDKLGPMTFGNREEHMFLGREVSRSVDYSESTAVAIDSEVSRIIKLAYDRAYKILTDKKEALDRIAKSLIEREVLEGEEITKLINGEVLPEKKPVDEPAEEPEDQATPPETQEELKAPDKPQQDVVPGQNQIT